jgi:uroporphyrinogen-III synthase
VTSTVGKTDKQSGESSPAARPLASRRIAVTRSTEQSQQLVERLLLLGADVFECPAIAIALLDDYSELDEAIRRIEKYDWVIFTSANGVQAFVDRLNNAGRVMKAPSLPKMAAIGPATANALASAGYKPDFVPDTYVAEAIVEQIGDVRGRRVLLPRADIARKALAVGLRDKGAEVDEITAYRTVPDGVASAKLASLLRSRSLDAITFTSSSTVRYTIQNLVAAGLEEQEATYLLKQTHIVCIGPVTAATAQELGIRVSKVAHEYTVQGLVAALLQLFGDPMISNGEDHAESKE